MGGAAQSNGTGPSSTLKPFKFEHLPLGSIKASGWLQDQLQLSADGLAGHLFDFYRYVQRSTWLGGDYEYSELNEAAPYWFNGIVPLAWTLDDERLKAQARHFLDYTLDHQAEDGWLGPESTRQTRGMWARALLFFGLTQYAEADLSQTDRIVTAMHKFVRLAHTMLKANFTGVIEDKSQKDNFDPFGFGLSRTHELPTSLMWLLEKHPRDNSAVITETIDLMFEAGRKGNRDWTTFFVDGVFPKVGTPGFKTSGFTHGVNLAEGLRYPTALYRRTGNESLVQQTRDAVNMTTAYQTSLSGTIIGDEHLGGLSPQRGSELCMAVESMFSYAYLYRFHGVNEYADRAELAAFNALPVAISADWWSHQYVTQTNQPWSRNLTAKPFFNVVSYGNTYGLEPNFPCCTVNHPQGYPKYVASSFVQQGQDTLVHILLGPTSVETSLHGCKIRIDCETNYPFSEDLRYSIDADCDFNFAVRIPTWTSWSLNSPSVSLSKSSSSSVKVDSAGLHHVAIQKGKTQLGVHLPMEIHTVTRNGSVGIYHGPLLYALDIAHTTSSHQPLNWTDRTPLPAEEVCPKCKDHVLEPTARWQYAIDPSTIRLERSNDSLANPVWTTGAQPGALWVDGYAIDWPVTMDSADLPPLNPKVKRADKTSLKLIPFGAAKVHIAQFPVADVED
ncbi:hypothetical protein, variant [Verruconis gallopava]|nr:hypothetical protein, variant [Verruconis gallopava]KIW04993.1 hypothetical protein, variant [Verruconis gallopava]